MIRGFRYQKVSLRISERGQRVYFNTESHKDYSLLKGLALSVGYDQALHGSTFGFRVDEKEILDESHEAHLLVFGNDVSPARKMLLFEMPVPVHASKIEGIYTDTAIQGLLSGMNYNPGGGIIPKSQVNIKKTYVSGKEIVKYGTSVPDVPGHIILPPDTGGIGNPLMVSSVTAPVYYPYDVKITLLLTR